MNFLNYRKIIYNEGHWLGDCTKTADEKYVANGPGILRVDGAYNGYTFIGFMKSNYISKGVKLGNDGINYLGSFKNGLYHGKGCLHNTKTGFYYIGEFANGLFNGVGVGYFPNDNIYYGEWKNGTMCGRGFHSSPGANGCGAVEVNGNDVRQIWTPRAWKKENGAYYFGNLTVNDQREGFGQFTNKTGKVRTIGFFDGGEINGLRAYNDNYKYGGRVLEVGEFTSTLKYMATGMLWKIYSNGDMCICDYLIGNKDGYGMHYDSRNKTLYSGGYKENLYHFEGSLIETKTNYVITGRWSYGHLNDVLACDHTGEKFSIENGKKTIIETRELPVHYGSLNGAGYSETKNTVQNAAQTVAEEKKSVSSPYSAPTSQSKPFSADSVKVTPSKSQIELNEMVKKCEDKKRELDKILADYNYRFYDGGKEIHISSVKKAKEHMEIPPVVTHLDATAFKSEKCAVIKTINVPKSVISIAKSCFSGCNELKSIELNCEIKAIEQSTLANTKIEEIIIPDSVKSIKANAFDGCGLLKFAYVPSGCKVDALAFPSSCTVLDKSSLNSERRKSAEIKAEANSEVKSEAKVMVAPKTEAKVEATVKVNRVVITHESELPDCSVYIKDGKVSLLGMKNETADLIIPEGITDCIYPFSINAFFKSNLKSVTLPSTVSVMLNGFNECKKVESVDIKNTAITTLEKFVFRKTSIKSLEAPDTVTRVAQRCFQECKNLESVIIRGAELIEAGAFSKCPRLRTVTVKKGCKIDPKAFDFTENIEIIYV